MSYSFWHTKRSETKEYDICVIGGGISGCSTAYWLKKEDPSLKIAVIEKGEIAAGATGRNAGFVTSGSVEHFNRLVTLHGKDKAYEIWKFSEDNLALIKQEFGDQEAEIDFVQNGTFSLASDNREMGELNETAKLMSSFDIPVEVLNEGDIEKRLNAKNFVGGIKYETDAEVNPVKLTQKMVDSSGVDFFPHHEVDSYEEGADGVTIFTQHTTFKCEMLVLATNAYLPLLSSYFDDKIFATKGQILVTEPIEKCMEAPCYAHFVLDYFRQLPTGHLLIGGFRQLEKETQVGYSDHTSQVIQDALADFIGKHLPKFKDLKIINRWGGIMGFSSDGQVFVGSMPGNSRVFFLGGFTAHGIGLAFHTGKALVDLIYGRPVPDFISARRFN